MMSAPAVVTFRFYAQLNDFLPARIRHQRVAHVIASSSSVKDAIEALGVPHPEVDVILINGKSEDFACRLGHGDDVSVYPAFRSIDVAGLRRTGVDPPRPGRFVLDVHLRKLGSLLRLAGFDAVLRVRHTDPERQLAEVLERFDLLSQMEPFSRCLECNTPVVPVAAAAVADLLRPRTRTRFEQFHRCPGCGRVYWRGSHYRRLAALIERAGERLSRSSRRTGCSRIAARASTCAS